MRETEDGGGPCVAVGRKGSPLFQPRRHPPHSSLGASPDRLSLGSPFHVPSRSSARRRGPQPPHPPRACDARNRASLGHIVRWSGGKSPDITQGENRRRERGSRHRRITRNHDATRPAKPRMTAPNHTAIMVSHAHTKLSPSSPSGGGGPGAPLRPAGWLSARRRHLRASCPVRLRLARLFFVTPLALSMS